MFHGSYTALLTPFKAKQVDEVAFANMIERQINAGTHGLVPCGTTGESPTLNHKEHNAVIEQCVEVAAGRAKVMAGTGSNSTREAVSMTQHAEAVGADAALVMTPYYNKPSQEGIYQHFKTIHDHSHIPIFLYNIPGRSVVDIEQDTMARLADLPRIVGVKDATADLARPSALVNRLGGSAEGFTMLSGEDATAVEFNQLGGKGCISVTANILPEECAAMQQACLDGDFAKAATIQDTLMPLHDVMFIESNPQPAKYAAHLLGLCEDTMRLPMVPPSEYTKAKIRSVMEQMKLI